MTSSSRPSRSTRSFTAVPGVLAEMSRISCSSLCLGFAVERDDDVVGTKAGAVARRPRRDVLNERPAADRQPERALQVGVDVPERDADIAAAHASVLTKLRE